MSYEFLHLLLLIIIANGAPIVTRKLFDGAFGQAIDLGYMLPDNRRLFGSSKTWRGVFSALFFTAVASWLLESTIETGLLIAVYAVCGDLCSSFIKRRLSMRPSSMAPLLDQVPESLLPAMMLRHDFDLDMASVFWLVLIFIIIELPLSHILYRWGVRNRPF